MNTKQQKFILQRANGTTYDKIAADLRVTKKTLINWSKLFEGEIRDLQFETFIKIKEAYTWNTQKRYETLLKQLYKIDNSILEADLSRVSLKDLYTIKNDILTQLDKIEKTISANPNITQTDEFGYEEQLDIKLNEVT